MCSVTHYIYRFYYLKVCVWDYGISKVMMPWLIINRVYKMFDWFAGGGFRCSSALCLVCPVSFVCIGSNIGKIVIAKSSPTNHCLINNSAQKTRENVRIIISEFFTHPTQSPSNQGQMMSRHAVRRINFSMTLQRLLPLSTCDSRERHVKCRDLDMIKAVT